MQITSPKSKHDFERYYELRWRILRKPWGKPQGSEQDEDENLSFHLMATENEQALGVARLQNITPTEAQLRYMAVDNKHEGKGIGKKIIQSMENHAKNNNIDTIMLHARENAVGFYENMGYTVIEKSYLLFDCIQHYKMKKEL